MSEIKYHQESFQISTHGRGTIEITNSVHSGVNSSNVNTGLCHVFIHHTSASLIICENADSDVRIDLESFMSRIAPDGDPLFIHTSEGDDDMPAHIRSTITHTELSIPIIDGKLALGTWQGVYLWEHRHAPHSRKITLTVHGISG